MVWQVDLQRLGETDQVGERAGLHLLHDLGPVGLDGPLARSQLVSHLLIGHPGYEEGKNFIFAGELTH